MAEATSGVRLVVCLTEDDVPGASLDEPMERQSIPALKRWLLCRGIEMPRSTRKKQLLARLVWLGWKKCFPSITLCCPPSMQNQGCEGPESTSDRCGWRVFGSKVVSTFSRGYRSWASFLSTTTANRLGDTGAWNSFQQETLSSRKLMHVHTRVSCLGVLANVARLTTRHLLQKYRKKPKTINFTKSSTNLFSFMIHYTKHYPSQDLRLYMCVHIQTWLRE